MSIARQLFEVVSWGDANASRKLFDTLLESSTDPDTLELKRLMIKGAEEYIKEQLANENRII